MIEIGQFADQPILPKLCVVPELEEASYALAWALQHCDVSPKVKMLNSIADAKNGQLLPNELWLWVGAVPEIYHDDIQALEQILDQATRQRLSRLARKQDKASVGVAHASVRLLLGLMLDVAPSELKFQRGSNGKPYLASPQNGLDGLHFNLSHTQGAVAVAIAREPVGVDIEIQRDLPDFLEIAETVFADETVVAIANAAGCPQLRSIFYRHWTLGEALIKATGGGMSHDLKSFAFSSRGMPRLSRAEGDFSHTDHWAFGIHGVGK